MLPLLRERAGVRGPTPWKKPLTLTLSQWEREKKVPAKIDTTTL